MVFKGARAQDECVNVCVCVWTIALQLSISFSMVISHRASPPLCSAIHCSSLGWTLCHFSLQRFSLCFLKAKGGLANKASLDLHFFSAPRLLLSPALPPVLPSLLSFLCRITSLLARLGWLYRPAGQWRFSYLSVFFPSVFFCPRGVAIKRETTPATRTWYQTIGTKTILTWNGNTVDPKPVEVKGWGYSVWLLLVTYLSKVPKMTC